MRPIRQTVEVARELGTGADGSEVLEGLLAMSAKVQAVVPDCIGLSVAWIEDEVAFTLVATDEEIAQLDAVQYLDSGPCVDAAHVGHGLATFEQDLLDEDNWQLFGQATAAKGVRSTVTFPIVEHGVTVGTINLYALTDDAFAPHIERLAEILGAWAPGVIRNADLSFRTRGVAEQAPEALRAKRAVDVAAGLVAVRHRTDVVGARTRVEDAARRAGIAADQFARALIELEADS